MKNIFIISDSHPEKGSGIEKVMFEVGKKLSSKYNIYYIFKGKRNESVEDNKMIYVSIKCPNIKGIDTLYFSLKSFLFLKKQKVDLIIDNIGASFFSSMFLKFKIIGVCHGVSGAVLDHVKFKNILDKVKYFLFFGLNDILTKYVFKKSVIVITLSKYLKKELMKYYGIPEEKIKIIYNGFDSVDCDIKKKTASNGNNLNVLFISNDHVRKGINILEDVAKSLIFKNIKFYIAGNNYISIYDNIIYVGKLKREELYNLMKESDIIFLPSYYEGQPLVILEAMNFGCIPVISKNCHMDMIEESELKKYIVFDNKMNKYVTIFQELINSKNIEKIKEISSASIKKFSRERQTEIYLKHIENLL